METRPFIGMETGLPVALETRGVLGDVLAGLTRWHGSGQAVPCALVPVRSRDDVQNAARALAPGGLQQTPTALAIPEDRFTRPGMRSSLAIAHARVGMSVVVTDVAVGSTLTATAPDRPGDILVLAPSTWQAATTDGAAQMAFAAVVRVAQDLGWVVWAHDVPTAHALALLTAAGVVAASGPALGPWVPAERLADALAPTAAPVAAPPATRTATMPPSPLSRRRRRRIGWPALALIAGTLLVVVVLGIRWGFVPGTDADTVQYPVVDGGHSQLARQGFNLTAWGSNDFNTRHAREALRHAAALGANTVAIVVTQYVSDRHSGDVHPVKDKTPSDRSLRRIIRVAKSMGFFVSLKPHVDTLSGDWRGDINPSDFDAFATSYRRFVLHYARLAERQHVPEFIAGTELKQITRRMAEAGNGGDEVVAAIRGVYHGSVGYAANWDNIDAIPFWNKVDFIGIDAYFPLGGSGDVAALVAAWQPYKAQALALAHQYDKPLVLTEAGYENREGASLTPWGVPSDARLDDDEQVRNLQALFTAWSDVPELQGIYLWQLYAGNPADLHPGDWTVIGKPAAQVVQDRFGHRRGP